LLTSKGHWDTYGFSYKIQMFHQQS